MLISNYCFTNINRELSIFIILINPRIKQIRPFLSSVINSL
nr:MAG TPA: hypothetical protein [Crassvirales sp.]